MAQIRQVVSETLQATIRRLLPSQQGFTEDLMASNVIQPIIDLTPSAEGSALPVDLSRALAHGSQTSITIQNATNTTIVNTTGFYRVFGDFAAQSISGVAQTATLNLFDGTTSKLLTGISTLAGSTSNQNPNLAFDFIIFLAAGESLRGSATSSAQLLCTTRQVADINGNLVNPSGFTAS